MITIQRRFQWAMGHTLKDHNGPCKHLHGHNYVGLFTIRSPELDDQGMVLDFGKVKEVIGGFIDGTLDHLFYIHCEDPRASQLQALEDGSVVLVPFNPTAENLARWLCIRATDLLNPDLKGMVCTQVELWETENCKATYVRFE